jgi:NAD(P)-dependent dehydrogenase (short-subunit alcohol dehydrogenase family)
MTERMTAPAVAMVTGANKGIGEQVAVQLAGLGMTVLLGCRDAGRGERAAAAIRAGGGDAHPVPLDVTDGTSVAAAARHVADRYGRLDVLVNNAGIAGSIPAQRPGAADLDVVRAVFETNVFGVVAVTDAVLPLLLEAPAGRIVNMSSSLGSVYGMSTPGSRLAGLPASAAYVPSKSALNALTVQYAKVLRGTRVLVNAADPGGCDTDLTRPLGYTVARTAAQGAGIAVRLATLPAGGPSGGYFNDSGPLPW